VVVLLAAIALHRIAYGLVLIAVFSLGLASVLIVIGVLAVCAQKFFERIPASGHILRWLPVVSAGAIVAIGVLLTQQSIGAFYFPF
jgi:ABC-type nickel/cobalt efflux system permease component RcnA